MPFELRITDAGRAALADGENRGTNAIRLTKMAIGDGSGPGGSADDSRTALRNQRTVAALGGTTEVAGRIAVRGEFSPAAAYGVTELGLLGQVGDGAEELYAYWTDDGERLASTVANTRLVIAGSLDISPAAAEVTVNVDASVSLGDPALTASVTALGTRADALEAADTALDTRVDALEDADFGALITALTARVATLESGGDSVINSIQRGVMNAASVTIAEVDASKSMLNITSVHYAYASQYAHASRYAYATRTRGTSTGDFNSQNPQHTVNAESRTISSRSVTVGNARLTLSASGTRITRTGSAVEIGYEVIEFA